MAGIHIELKKLLQRDSFSSTLWAYIYAGINSAGPLILSILGILLVGLINLPTIGSEFIIVQFQVSVTYLIAASLIVTGLMQLSFTRFISDRIFEKKYNTILSNYNSVTFINSVISGTVGIILLLLLFSDQSTVYQILMLSGFVILSNIWIGVIFLASLKQYKTILLSFFIGYLITVLLALALNRFGLEGLLSGFIIGHLFLFIYIIITIHRNYSSQKYVSWEIIKKNNMYPSLIAVGVFFNLGIWIDKFIFWFSDTGQNIIGPLRASVIYDIPIFISYLCIIPGMAVFLLRLETDFTDSYNNFYQSIRLGGTFGQIETERNKMISSMRTGLYDILKIQSIVILLIFSFGDDFLELLDISVLYLPLLKIDVIASSLQVLFLGVLNFFFYLDKRKTVLILTFLFFILNGIFSSITLYLGPSFYGYGFAGSLLIVVLIGVYSLNQRMKHLEYETYMLQKSTI